MFGLFGNTCPDCQKTLTKTEIECKNCTRIEYRCECGFYDADFRDIVGMPLSQDSSANTRKQAKLTQIKQHMTRKIASHQAARPAPRPVSYMRFFDEEDD